MFNENFKDTYVALNGAVRYFGKNTKIETENGAFCPAVDAGLIEGDVIRAINGRKVCTNEEVAECIENSEGKALDFLMLEQ